MEFVIKLTVICFENNIKSLLNVTKRILVNGIGQCGIETHCDTPKPGGPLTTRQPAKDLWMSGNPTLHHRVPFFGTHDLTKIGQIPKIQHVQKNMAT